MSAGSEHLAALGRVAVAFSKLERTVYFASEAIAPGSGPGFGKRLRALSGSVRRGNHNHPMIDDFRLAVVRALRAAGMRHTLFHRLWKRSSRPRFSLIEDPGALRDRQTAQVERLAVEIDTAAEALSEALRAIYGDGPIAIDR